MMVGLHSVLRACAITATIVALAGIGGGCSLDGFMFGPTVAAEYNLPNDVIADSLVTPVTFTSGSATLYGFFVSQPDSLLANPHPVVLYHHGNDENLAHHWTRVELLWRCGFSVFVYDYQGYGRSSGESTGEPSILQDAEAAYQALCSHHSVDTSQIVQYGFSLGGFPAIYLAGKHPTQALITESAFASGQALVQSGTVLNIPGRYLLQGAFNNAVNISKVNVKYLLLHGTDDAFIPFNLHATPLFQHARNPKTLLRVEGAAHSNVPFVLGEQNYIDVITAFVRGG